MTRFQKLMRAPPWRWELALPSVADFALLTKRTCPFMAHTKLLLPSAALNYLGQLDPDRDVSRHYGGRSLDGFFDARHKIKDWHHNPAHSSAAKATFYQLASGFFPDRPGRHELLTTCADYIARYASAIDYSQLGVELKAFGQDFTRTRFEMHRDIGDTYSAGLYLKGPTTAHLLPFWGHPVQYVRDRRSWQADLKDRDNRATVQCPPLTLSMWPSQQWHSLPITHGLSRFGIFLFASQDHNSPALRPAPS